MNNDYIEKLAKELEEINYKGTVVFAGYGEPMLDKNIYENFNIFYLTRKIGICFITTTFISLTFGGMS